MFRNEKKALEGSGFCVSMYNRYRLKLSYDEENNPNVAIYEVRHKDAHNETFRYVKTLDITEILEQAADFAAEFEASADE